ncbi:ParB/RepB/Spo0J family partition protein [Pseudooceanicola marinus]|uniref:ParB/RepB/Spo0J family partition protein n=1 Tax=Pseudooceanicola marinus TaxID=396013 RepID=UPI001CD8011F|nr:ParB N-terminal domain-containing protein [Pseudooceanicola marinus]MCA1338172.1 ParB N-terminal domain-containing protein [Pseudooceanicola marinus]
MAKRKRLTPANPEFLGTPEGKPLPQTGLAAEPEVPEAAPETKSIPLGVAPVRTRQPPIARVSGESAAQAALEELSAEMTRARDEGRLVQSLPLSAIDPGHLVRDRMAAGADEDLTALVESLRARGQQTPIEVVDHGPGARPRYGLISGWRRLSALTQLQAEDPTFGQVLALIRAPKTASEAYVAMVEENEIRVGLSYYERARIAVKSVEQGVYPDLKTALNTLFANVSRAKRSKIKSFTRLVEALDGALSFPTQIGERLGLDLARRLEEEPGLEDRLRGRLAEAGPANPQEEQALLAQAPGPSDPGRRAPAEGEVQTDRRGGVAIRYDSAKGRAVLTGLDARTHAALLAWLDRG